MTFVGVCGGRYYRDSKTVDRILSDNIAEGDAIVHGGATGADSLAGNWARHFGYHEVIVPAIWEKFGRAAGPRRNSVIAALPLRKLIAFPGGTGTADCVRQCRASGIEVLEVRPGDEERKG